jgi:hypothetical protein
MNWIQTYTNRKFDYSDVESYAPTVEEVAHCLSNTCRYNGHCKVFYSVAEHVARCAQLAFKLDLSPTIQYAALHHDDDEAYTGDVVRPLKQMLRVVHHEGYHEAFSTLEKRIQAHCRATFAVTWDDEIAGAVRDLDNVMLLVEKEFLLGPEPEPWAEVKVPDDWFQTARLFWRWPLGRPPAEAKEAYLERHAWLLGLLS